MNNIEFKEFRIGDLFDKLDLKSKEITPANKATALSTIPNEEFNLPLVNAKHGNNGIMYYGRQKEWEYAEYTIDIVSDGAKSTGDVYPQIDKTGILYNAYLIKLKTGISTEEVLLYLSTAIYKSIKPKYSYNEKATWDKVKNDTILLPITKDGKPNFDYMEQYTIKIKEKVNKALILFDKINNLKEKVIDTTNWKEFRVGDLFYKLDLKSKEITSANKATELSTIPNEEFNLPLVNAKHGNNGIMYYGREEEWEYAEYTIDIVSDGAKSTGDVYPQIDKTGILYNAYLIKLKTGISTEEVLLYLSTAIYKSIKPKYSYNEKATWDKVKNDTILLPITKDGKPNFNYMEQYIKKTQNKVQKHLNNLTHI